MRGLNTLLGIVSAATTAPIIIGSRLRKGAAGSLAGAGKFVGDILATVRRLRSASASGLVLLRADSAFYGHAVVLAAHRAGAKVSITAWMDRAVKRAIGAIPDDVWTTIQYTDAIREETTGTRIFSAEVAEIAFTAFSSRKRRERITGRLVVRRIPELNPFDRDGQPTLFDTHRFHAFFTTSDLDTVTADKTHRGHAIVEQVKARSGTIRRALISIPVRISTSARKIVLHLPSSWPWEAGWTELFTAACGPPRTATI